MNTKPVKTLTSEQSHALLEALTKHRDTDHSRRHAARNHLIALLALDAGLRIGEILQLQVADLVIENQPVISLLVRGEIAKRQSERSLKLTDRLHAAVEATHILIWLPDRRPDSSLAFYSTKNNHALSYQQVERIFAKAAQQACHCHVTPHMLRHTFATRLMRVTSMRVVQGLLGHKQITSTQIYTHPTQTDHDAAIDNLPQTH